MLRIAREVGAVAGQSASLAPADKRLRCATSPTVDAIPLIASSIM